MLFLGLLHEPLPIAYRPGRPTGRSVGPLCQSLFYFFFFFVFSVSPLSEEHLSHLELFFSPSHLSLKKKKIRDCKLDTHTLELLAPNFEKDDRKKIRDATAEIFFSIPFEVNFFFFFVG